MKIFITNLPSFYKIKLYNQINMKCNILVVYTDLNSNDRNQDFYSGEMQFRYIFLEGSTFRKLKQLFAVLYNNKYNELILGGWDTLISWVAAAYSPRRKNAIVIESSLKESVVDGVKGVMKKVFVKRIYKAYVSGNSHRDLMNALGFEGEIVITKGVGLFNRIPQPVYQSRKDVRTFLYVGRLVAVKNLEYLIEKFNRHPELKLNIIGFGELEQKLKAMAAANISFLGAVNNKELPRYYQEADVFILPSLSETWGLVVEEALNNGTPVMLSNKVGCIDDIINKNNGVVFSLEKDDFEEKLKEIRDIERYNAMRHYISTLDYEKIEQEQVNCYLDA